MKLSALLFILLISTSGFAQTYVKYMEQGKMYYNNAEYMTALERFDLAYEFAKTEAEKEESQIWKSKSREQITQFQNTLQKALDEQKRLQLEEKKSKATESKLKDSVQKSLNNLLTEKSKGDRLRKMAIVKPLAFLAVKVSQDNKYESKLKTLSDEQIKLPLIMAYQAWYLNDHYNGNPNDPDVYAALSEVGDSSMNIRVQKHTDVVRDIVVSESGNEFASCSDDGNVEIYKFSDPKNPETMNLPKTEKNFYFRSLVFSPDEKMLATGTYQGEILIWDIANNKSWILYEPTRSVNKSRNKSVNKLIALKNSLKLVSVSSDGFIRYWNFNDFQTVENRNIKIKDSVMYFAAGERYTTAALTDDESKFAVATDAGIVRIFNSNTQVLETTFKSDEGKILSICWNNKNDLIIGFESGWIEIRNGSNVKSHRAHDSGVTDIHFDNQANRMITSSYDGKIKIWNFDGLDAEPASVKGHSDWVSCIALTKDNSKVLSGSADKSVLISKINIQELKNSIRNKIFENMSHENWNKYVGEDIEYSKELP